MAKFKIQKGLSDAEMMKQWGGNDNFEETMMQAERNAAKPVIHQSPKQTQDAFYREFLTEKVETLIGKMLLDIKMEYFKEGEGASVSYTHLNPVFQVSGNTIISGRSESD